MAYLLSAVGPSGEVWHELDKPKTILGRHPSCTLVIDALAVSRQHAQILREGSQFLVEDLNSRNGTFVNDHPIQGRVALKDGDTLRICDATFTYRTSKAVADSPTGTAPSLAGVDAGGFAAVLVDDDQKQALSTIMSKLDVSSSRGRVLMSASAEVKLGALIEITQNLGKALQLDEVLPQVLKSLFKIFLQADRGFIVLRDESGRLIPRWTKLRRENNDETVRISRTICTQVMESGEAILSADAASDTRFEMSQSIADFRIRSMMCAPLVNADGESFGVLQIDTLDQRNKFRNEDLEVLVAVASQAAIAIENARMHERSLRQRELERDLQLAHQVQKGFLPQQKPRVAGYSFYDYYQPANHVGGDYFDYIHLPDGRLAVILADVVGHGVAAALLMAKFSAEARFSLASTALPKVALKQLNDAICRAGIEDRFITCVAAVLTPETHEVTIVNAGHMAPIVRRASGRVEEAGESIAGVPLGILDDFDYEQATIQLEPGEWLTLYTDGINECTNRDNVQYGIDRVRAKVENIAQGPLVLGQFLVDDVRNFLGSEAQGDDMCLVCFGRPLAWTDEVLDDDSHDVPHPLSAASRTAIGRA